MIKTLIVDDDVEMLDWLEQVVPWKKNGFKIIGRAKNGAEAYELCIREMPELIITDITMPKVDGLELISLIKKDNPDVKSVMLTCHEDFKFAQEALKINADDYVLKYTLTSESLEELLRQIKTKIEEEKSQKEGARLLKSEILRNRMVLHEKFLTDIIDGTLDNNSEILQRASTLKIQMPNCPFKVICSYIDNYDESVKKSSLKGNLLKYSVINIADEIMNDTREIICLPYESDKVVMLFDNKDSDTLDKQELVIKLKRLHKAAKQFLEINMSSCISQEYKNYREIRIALQETASLRSSYFYNGNGEVVINKEENFNDDVEDLLSEDTNALQLSIDMGNLPESERMLNEVLKKAESLKCNPEKIKKLFLKIASAIRLKADIDNELVVAVHLNMDTYQSLKDQIRSIFDIYAKKLNSLRIQTSRKEVNLVLEYIDNNIGDYISCESMANMVHMNCSYFSRLFKKEVGLSFTDYMIQQRIKKATDLLTKTDMSIEDITKHVGLEQTSYFYKLYKKVTGKTPGEVRNEIETIKRSVIKI